MALEDLKELQEYGDDFISGTAVSFSGITVGLYQSDEFVADMYDIKDMSTVPEDLKPLLTAVFNLPNGENMIVSPKGVDLDSFEMNAVIQHEIGHIIAGHIEAECYDYEAIRAHELEADSFVVYRKTFARMLEAFANAVGESFSNYHMLLERAAILRKG